MSVLNARWKCLSFSRTKKTKIQINRIRKFYVDEDRNIIPTSVSDAAYLPVVSGRVTKSMAKGELFDFITFLEKDTFGMLK